MARAWDVHPKVPGSVRLKHAWRFRFWGAEKTPSMLSAFDRRMAFGPKQGALVAWDFFVRSVLDACAGLPETAIGPGNWVTG